MSASRKLDTIIHVKGQDGKPLAMDIPAELFGPLAFHRSIESNERLSDTWWTVTHLVTGWIVQQFPDYNTAIKTAKRLSILDWTALKSPKNKAALAKLGPQVKQIVEAIENERN